MKVGLLLPRSGEYPRIAIELTEAIRLVTGAENNNALQFISENIGFGESEKTVYNSAEKLLVTEGADLLIAYIDMKVISLLEPLIYATGKLLIVLNAGANYPQKGVPQKGIIFLSLQHSFMCSLTGNPAAKNHAGVFATTFYDCGYGHGAALTNGFTANGGQVVYNYINNCKPKDVFQIDELLAFLDSSADKSLSLICIFDEAPANLFYNALNAYEHADKLSLFVSPMMLTEKAIGDGGYRFPIFGHSTGPVKNLSGDDDPLTQLYFDKWQKKPGLFSLAGLQAGHVLKAILAVPADRQSDPDSVVAMLTDISLYTPAGISTLDPLTNFFITDAVLQCGLDMGDTQLKTTRIKTGKQTWDKFVGSQPDGLSSGWVNTYLCY